MEFCEWAVIIKKFSEILATTLNQTIYDYNKTQTIYKKLL